MPRTFFDQRFQKEQQDVATGTNENRSLWVHGMMTLNVSISSCSGCTGCFDRPDYSDVFGAAGYGFHSL